MSNPEYTQKPAIGYYLPYFFGPMSGALISHAPRVLVNRAVFNIDTKATWHDSKNHVNKAVGLNLLRGYSSIFMQYSIVEMQKKYFGIDYATKNMSAAILPAMGSTVVASLIETRFIRETALRNTVFCPANFVSAKYSLPLTAFYFARELGFARYLFGPQNVGETLFIAGYTSVFLKWIIWGATDDRAQNATTKTLPTFRKGKIIETVKDIAKGGVYTHPTCQVRYPNSRKPHELLYNLFIVSCPPHLYALRLFQLVVLKYSMLFGSAVIAPATAEPISSLYSFWTKKILGKPAEADAKQNISISRDLR